MPNHHMQQQLIACPPFSTILSSTSQESASPSRSQPPRLDRAFSGNSTCSHYSSRSSRVGNRPGRLGILYEIQYCSAKSVANHNANHIKPLTALVQARGRTVIALDIGAAIARAERTSQRTGGHLPRFRCGAGMSPCLIRYQPNFRRDVLSEKQSEIQEEDRWHA
jgi:hypothetical protein